MAAAAVHQQAAAEAVGQENEEQQQPGLVQGTLSSPRLTRQLSIRSKLLYTAIQEDDYETVVRLVEAKIREHEENYLGQQEHRFAEEPPAQDMPFLILATLKGNVRVMQFLLEKEVESVNVCDPHHGNTPLHYAVMMGGKGHTGRDVGPLAVVERKGRKRGRLASPSSAAALDLLSLACLRRAHARRASAVAAEQRLEACAKDLIGFLLRHGANPLLRNHKGVTPLMEMARYHVPPPPPPPASPLSFRRLPFALLYEDRSAAFASSATSPAQRPQQDVSHPVLVRMRQLLLAHEGVRATVDAQDVFGRTALFVAADALNAEAVRILLQTGGADPSMANARGLAPIDLLKSRGRAHMRILPTYWPVLRLLENALAEPDRRLLLLKARALGDEGFALAHAANAAMSKGASEAEGLQAVHDAAPSFLRPRLPAPASPRTPAIPSSDDVDSPPLPTVAVRWDRLHPSDGEDGQTAEVEAALLKTRLGVLQHVMHGAQFGEEHFREVMEMLRVRWDRADEEEEEGEEEEEEEG